MRALIESIAKINEGSDILVGNMELMDAYNESTRQLDVRGEAVDLQEWRRVMTSALHESDGEYNDFDVNDVYQAFISYGEDSVRNLKFRPAREYSVALYVHGEYDALEQVGNYIGKNRKSFANVDELHLYEDGTSGLPGPVLRLWWD